MSNSLVKASKFLAKHLRHTPEAIGLTLGVGGWVAVDKLLAACAKHGLPLTLAELEEIVVTNDKQRFAFDDTKALIRANQGHSVEIDLHLQPQEPPIILYHGTGRKSVAAILKTGLQKMSRHHVHLSADIETARRVGQRHGTPVVFVVKAQAMHEVGYSFYCSDNGVWLVDRVPVEFLQLQ